MSITIGSLFDGSGGFPLAGALCGFSFVWASEVEPYPIAVTKSRLPNMRHLGDISEINGENIEPVDIISFGSPCQGLSVAGRQKGLNDERSALFMEAIRIIKEMREATNGKYPRFAVWENVPGAFSSNKGEDFRLVLEELIKIAEPDAVMPEVPKKGWAYADYYCGDGWSIAYRVFDAQYIRTAQRRRRIYLVLDLGSQCAGQILFERQSLRGYLTESRAQRKTTPADAERSVGTDDREGTCSGTLRANAGDNQMSAAYGVDAYNQALTGDKSKTLNSAASDADHVPCAVYAVDQGAGKSSASVTEEKSPTLACTHDGAPAVAYSIENHPNDSRVKIDESGKVQALTSRMGTGGGNVPMVLEPFCKSTRAKSADDATTWKYAKVANTLNTFDQGEARANELIVALEGNGQRPSHHGNGYIVSDKSYTLNATEVHGVAYEHPIAIDRAFFNQGQNALYEPQTYEDGTTSTLVAKGPSAVAYSIGNGQVHDAMSPSKEVSKTLNCMVDPMKVCIANPPRYIVRRLTPTECARLQGFPDTWGHIDHKDDFTNEEFEFWLNVRNTHAEINGKQVKDYTKKQMLTWYNKLHTDSAEYKLWGNGIALPCALYVMQGIEDVLKGEQK